MNDLTERYIYAATKHLPAKQREDVAQELRGLIDDMLAERCTDRPVEEKDLRVVLTELGSPQELYVKYAGDGDKRLIGQPYYTTYKLVLKIVCIAVAVGMTIASFILRLLEPQGVPGTLLTWFGNVWNGLLSAFAIVTLLFAFFEKKQVRIGQGLSLDDLPEVPKKRQKISKWECIGGIGISILFVVVFLTAPKIFCVPAFVTGEYLPVFSPEAARSTWYIVLLFAACGITREIVKLLEGQYTRRVLWTCGIVDAVTAVLSVWWLKGFDLMNPAFLAAINELFPGDNVAAAIFSNFQSFFLGVLLFALALDFGDAAYRTLKK